MTIGAIRLLAISDAASMPSRRGIRLEALGEVDRLLPVAGLADDLVAFFAQHLGQVQPDECLVLGYENAARLVAVGR
jgi:hypothetical protein